MKKLISMLSLAAIVASALFVSCAKPKEPTLVPAFPYNKTATYAQNEDTGLYGWSWDSADEYSNAKGVGFAASLLDNKTKATYLEYRAIPNADWSLEILGDGKEYVEVCLWKGEFDAEKCIFGSTVSGERDQVSFEFRTKKTPAANEEPVTVEVGLTMCGETMVVVTLVLEPSLF